MSFRIHGKKREERKTELGNGECKFNLPWIAEKKRRRSSTFYCIIFNVVMHFVATWCFASALNWTHTAGSRKETSSLVSSERIWGFDSWLIALPGQWLSCCHFLIVLLPVTLSLCLKSSISSVNFSVGSTEKSHQSLVRLRQCCGILLPKHRAQSTLAPLNVPDALSPRCSLLMLEVQSSEVNFGDKSLPFTARAAPLLLPTHPRHGLKRAATASQKLPPVGWHFAFN